jgi:hypothetical protein
VAGAHRFFPDLCCRLNLACSKKPLPGDASFIQAKKGFEKELTPDQRKAAIKQLQTQTAGKP